MTSKKAAGAAGKERTSAPAAEGTNAPESRVSKRRVGRPATEEGLSVKRDGDGNILKLTVAQSPNWAALAHAVMERIDQHLASTGKKLKIKDAVKTELLEAIHRNNNWPVDLRPASWKFIGEYRANGCLKTAYIEVRKRIAEANPD